MDAQPLIKKCQSCGREFKGEKEVLDHGSRWRICDRGSLWFNCECRSTLMIPKGKFDWFAPENLLRPDARTVFNKLGSLKKLPNIPATVMEMTRLMQDENVTSGQLAALAKKAPIIAANILKLANSFKFSGRTKKIESLEHAITYVGLNTIRDIVVTASIQSFSNECQVFNADQFWNEALLTGRIAETLAREFNPTIQPDEAYIAGCLCDVGKIVMSICLPDTTDTITREENDPKILRSWANGEAKHGAPSHRILGEIGASFWGMPEFVVDSANSHHKMPAPGGQSTISINEITGLASQLTHWLTLEPGKMDKQLLLALAAKFGFTTEQQLDAYVEKIFNLRNAA